MSKAITKKPKAEVVNLQDQIIRLAADPSFDPNKLEQLMNLQLKMEERQAGRELHEALADFQSECPIISKNAKTHNKSEYAKFDHMVHTIKPFMGKYGLSFSFTTEPVTNGYTRLITTIKHRSGASISSRYDFPTVEDSGNKNETQAVKSAFSYARRAGLEAALGLATANEDDDAQRAVNTPISEDQKATVLAFIKSTNTDIEKFLSFIGRPSIDSMNSDDAKRAIHAFNQKRSSR